jgi:hypothetical protein
MGRLSAHLAHANAPSLILDYRYHSGTFLDPSDEMGEPLGLFAQSGSFWKKMNPEVRVLPYFIVQRVVILHDLWRVTPSGVTDSQERGRKVT